MEHDCSQGERLGVIETTLVELARNFEASNKKLDQITDLLISNARIETKLEDFKATIKDHEVRLREVEKASTSNTYFSSGFKKFLWMVGGGVVSFMFFQLPKLFLK